MNAPTSCVALHSARIAETGDALSIFLIDTAGQLCNVDLPLNYLLARARVVDPQHHAAPRERADLEDEVRQALAAGEDQLRDAIRQAIGR